MRRTVVLALLATVLVPLEASASDCARTSVGYPALTEPGAGHEGEQGGLYPGGANERPAEHEQLGALLSRLAVPRNAAGIPDAASGRSVFLSIGMSNTNQESSAFAQLAQSDAQRHPQVLFVNGAQGGQDAVKIADATAPYWSYVDSRLAAAGATAAQVQAVWLKEAIARPDEAFPDDARRLSDLLAKIVRILKLRFPNLWTVYLSSRIYAGYATTTLNPEPYAYQSGYAVKWLIEDQIDGSLPLGAHPWLSWGPYLWADGTTARADGLTWECADFNQDGTHPSASGAQKVAQQLLAFVHSDPTAKIWYERAGAP